MTENHCELPPHPFTPNIDSKSELRDMLTESIHLRDEKAQ